MMGAVRLRVFFKNKQFLGEALAKDGLTRSWIVLKPHLTTIADLSSYILAIFHLHDACPDGLILSMDGFVLPPFESVCILKDKDIIRVKKKSSGAINIHKVSKKSKFRERQAIDEGVKLLADKEIGNESVDYECESKEEDPKGALPVESAPVKKKASKKRKASKIIHTPKKKKIKSSPTEEFPTIIADVQNDNAKHERSNHMKCDFPSKVLVSKNDSSSSSSESDTCSSTEIDGRINITSKSAASAERVDEREVGRRKVELSTAVGESKKGPSRSSRRKKAKRRWLREQANNQSKNKDETQNKEQQQLLVGTSIHQEPSKNDDTDMEDDTDVEDDTVPVVIRPGHIRFEPIGKVADDQAGQQKHFPTETLHWNGITNKKKGQKWGTEKTQSWKRNNNVTSTDEPLQLPTPEAEEPKTSTPVVSPINFDKLRLCTSIPQEGVIVAYRLIELSSTWTPELSSFRVGKVSWYDTESNRIMLIPVPEYPLAFKKEMDEDSTVQVDTFPYGEDGSLKIDFASLIDLRLIAQENGDSSRAAIDNKTPNAKQNAESSFKHTNSNGDTNHTRQDNGKVSAWDEISEALSAKKAQLSQNDGWSPAESSGRTSWSYRALRGSALGPTMALLRAQNEL